LNQSRFGVAGYAWPETKQGDDMSNTPHTLGEEFPGKLEVIHALKAKDSHFARVLEEYDEVNDQIHRAETNIEPIGETAEIELRKRRLVLKDEIAKAIATA
jgi:uncharacterized protein